MGVNRNEYETTTNCRGNSVQSSRAVFGRAAGMRMAFLNSSQKNFRGPKGMSWVICPAKFSVIDPLDHEPIVEPSPV